MRTVAWFAVAAAAAWGFVAGGPAPALAAPPELGDEAPELDVLEWVQGDPVVLEAQKGKGVVLIDLFTVNDPRVPGHFEKLSELQEKHPAPALRIVALGVDAPDDVRKFVQEHPCKFTVGVDNLRNTAGSYGNGSPPVTALVDKEGRLCWRGYVADAEKTVEKVLAGKYDVEREKRVLDLRRSLQKIFNTQDTAQIAPAADALLAEEPSDWSAIQVKKWCFAKDDQPEAWRAWVAGHLPKMTESDGLNALAWDLATEGNLQWREPAVALGAAKKAVEASEAKDAAILDTLARVYSELGLLDRAVEEEKRAIAALGAEADESEKTQYQRTLAYYEQCAKLAKEERPAPPKKPDPKKKGGK